MTLEMHPSRWGDPARAQSLPTEARGLVEMVFGVDDRPAVEAPPLASPAISADVLALLGRARLLLMPSEWEGLPVTLMEACWAGVPAVVRDAPGMGTSSSTA